MYSATEKLYPASHKVTGDGIPEVYVVQPLTSSGFTSYILKSYTGGHEKIHSADISFTFDFMHGRDSKKE